MRTLDAIAHILKKEGIEYLSAFPTTPVIESAADIGIRPIICRQERVGVGIADGYSRVTNGRPPGVFAMQYGPGAENAYAGVATAFSDAVPMLLLPLGSSERQGRRVSALQLGPQLRVGHQERRASSCPAPSCRHDAARLSRC